MVAETKLLFLVRHGQAWSNYLEEVLGPGTVHGCAPVTTEA